MMRLWMTRMSALKMRRMKTGFTMIIVVIGKVRRMMNMKMKKRMKLRKRMKMTRGLKLTKRMKMTKKMTVKEARRKMRMSSQREVQKMASLLKPTTMKTTTMKTTTMKTPRCPTRAKSKTPMLPTLIS